MNNIDMLIPMLLGSCDVKIRHPNLEQGERQWETLLDGPDGRVRGDPGHRLQGSVRPVLRLYPGDGGQARFKSRSGLIRDLGQGIEVFGR